MRRFAALCLCFAGLYLGGCSLVASGEEAISISSDPNADIFVDGKFVGKGEQPRWCRRARLTC